MNDDTKSSDEVVSTPAPTPTRTDLAKELEIDKDSLMPDGLPVSLE